MATDDMITLALTVNYDGFSIDTYVFNTDVFPSNDIESEQAFRFLTNELEIPKNDSADSEITDYEFTGVVNLSGLEGVPTIMLSESVQAPYLAKR